MPSVRKHASSSFERSASAFARRVDLTRVAFQLAGDPFAAHALILKQSVTSPATVVPRVGG
jgi:hypothetical protein